MRQETTTPNGAIGIRADAVPGGDKGHPLWIAALTLMVMASGMAFSLWWAPVLHHVSLWLTPGDLWSAVRGAHWVGWGALSYIYSYHSALVTLPGLEILLAPVVMISSWLNLSENSPTVQYQLLHPTAWLLVGPVVMTVAWPALHAADSLARRLLVGDGRRRVLTVAVAVAVWPCVVIWGHPEDVLGFALAVIATLRAFDRRYTSAGWFLGAAIAIQLLVLLLIPLFIGMVGWRKAPALLARASIIPGFLAVAVLVPDFHQASRVLLEQVTFPAIGHPTPWISLAPRVAMAGGTPVVAGSHSRIGAFVVAVGAGFLVARRRGDLAAIAWLIAAVFAARCLFESVMEAYYVMPVVTMALIVGSTRRGFRWVTVLAAGLVLTCQTFHYERPWVYYGEMGGLIAVLLLASVPVAPWRRSAFPRGDETDALSPTEPATLQPAAAGTTVT